MSLQSLLPINQIVKLAKASGATFGFGNPKTHLAYLTKLHLLPQAVRRKVNGQIVGCYPESVVETLSRIENLKDQGLSYSQIRFELSKGQTATPNYAFSQFPVLAFLIVGLVLGYLVAVVSKTSDIKPVALPTNANLTSINTSHQSQPIYLIALPEKNLYKLGTVDLQIK